MAAALRTETPENAGCLLSEPEVIMSGDEVGTASVETFEPVPSQTNPFVAAMRERLGFLEGAVARMEQGESTDAALREIGTFLLDLLTLVERDPGLELAADDLYEAAAILATAPSRKPSRSRTAASKGQILRASASKRLFGAPSA